MADIKNITIDGTTYDIKDAKARNDITDLKEDLDILDNGGQNFIEDYGLTIQGELVATDGVNVSDFVPVVGGHTVTAYGSESVTLTNIRLVEYSANKTLVDYWGANPSKTITLHNETKFLRLSFDARFSATITDDTASTLLYTPNVQKGIDERIEDGAKDVIAITDWDNVIPSAEHDPLTNYIDIGAVTTGYINGNGVYTPYATLRCTDYIPLEQNTPYYWGTGVYSGKYYGFYDADKNVISSGNTLGDLAKPFTIPVGAVYGRFTILNDASDNIVWIYTQNGRPLDYAEKYYFGAKMNGAVNTALEEKPPTSYDGMDIQAFNTAICIGDSLTEGIFNYDNSGDTGYDSIPEMSYPSALERITGIDVLNKGSSGLTSKEWYTSHQNDDLSGNKLAIVQFGVNDVIRYGQGWTQDSIDGYTSIINKLKTENTNIKIFVSTVMPAVSYPPSNYATYNAGLKSFVESLNDTNVILLDMATYGNTAPTQYNAGHLSAYGYWRLAKDYANYISWYMYNNGMQFREIQFIGTNKHY